MIIDEVFELKTYNMSVMIPKRKTGFYNNNKKHYNIRNSGELNNDIDSIEITGDILLDGYKYNYTWRLLEFSRYNIKTVNDITKEMLLDSLNDAMENGSVVSYLLINNEDHRYLLDTCKPFCDKYQLHPKLFRIPRSIIFQENKRQKLYYEKTKIERDIGLTDHVETYETRDGQRVVTFNPYFLNRDYEKLYKSGFFAPLRDAGCEVKILDSSYVSKGAEQGNCVAIYLPDQLPAIPFFRLHNNRFTKSDMVFLNVDKHGWKIKEDNKIC